MPITNIMSADFGLNHVITNTRKFRLIHFTGILKIYQFSILFLPTDEYQRITHL